MTRRIVVVGNCQAGGVAAALQRIFWADEVNPVPMTLFPQGANAERMVKRGAQGIWARRAAENIERVRQADLVIGARSVLANLQAAGTPPAEFIALPSLYFSAFHPDLVPAMDTPSGRLLPYNSAIALWAYNHQLTPSEARRLFTREVFAALGYFDRWDSSVQLLRGIFEATGLEFDRFWLAVKREGCFMHTINHPRACALTWLAKALAIRAGHDRSLWNREILINDALGNVESWPVYPEVARELALPGSYGWFLARGTLVDGLDAYIEHAYRGYAEGGVQPGALEMQGRELAAYDAVLPGALQRA